MSYPEQPGGWSDPSGQPTPPEYPAQPTTGDGVGYDYPPTTPYAPQGYAVAGYAASYSGPVVTRPTNGMAIAALVCSLAGLITCISAPIGAILGHIARKQIRTTGEAGDGMALAGIIVGWTLTGLTVVGCGFYLLFIVAIGGAALTGGAS